jgi:putative glycosyltransferase (TIGR04372 family)
LAELFKKIALPPDVKLTDVGLQPERPFQILGLLETTTLGDLLSNVVFLSTLANQFDHVRLHVKFRNIRPYSAEIMSLSPWIDLAEPFPGEWPRWIRNSFPQTKLLKPFRQMEIGSQKGKHVYLYDMIITSLMAHNDTVHALPNIVPLRLPEARLEELRNRLIALGLTPDRWFAVVHYRESSYRYRPGSGDRDSDPAAFDALVDHIIALGGQAVRLGHPGSTHFRPRDGFVDLSRQTDNFMVQAAAVSHARFMIAGPSGPMALPLAFAVPNTLVDAADTGGVWGLDYSDVLTHEVVTPKGDILRNQSLLDAGLLDAERLVARLKAEPGYRVRKATSGELGIVAGRLYERTTDCPTWRPPAKAPSGPKPNQIMWPLRLTYPMPWLDL